ncbi:MAG: hypothetical protein NWF03_00345 [Candidatus Bathyarchaeota archaeon]|nr:hypothetical protein [Candidatus Bathyarchaeota archaeon]
MIWQVFSQVVKPFKNLQYTGRRTDAQNLYGFHESVIEAIKPVLNEGVRSVVVSAPARTTYASEFLEHIRKHHRYLIQSKGSNKANFGELVGSANSAIEVGALVKTKQFTDLIEQTTSDEASQIVDVLEKNLYRADDDVVVLYSLKEIEDNIYDRNRNSQFKTEYLLLTDRYLATNKTKSKVHRLLQIAQNKKVKTRVVNSESAAGSRINQFGGLVFFSIPSS